MYEEQLRRLEHELARSTDERFAGYAMAAVIVGVPMCLVLVGLWGDPGAIVFGVGIVVIVLGLPTFVWLSKNNKRSARELALEEQIRAVERVIERNLGIR